jgi:peptide deformylase
MSILEIRIYPDPILKNVAQAVSLFDLELKTLVESMFETMYAARGIGLAAPQIGVSKRIVVIDISEDGDERHVFINPKILKAEGQVSGEEGCLSIPDFRERVARYERVQVQAQDVNGNSFTLDTEGLLAICLQHEIDHLDGILFVDRLSRLKREIFKRWLKKQTA